MRALKTTLGIIAALIVVMLLAGPLGPLPGLFIGGEEQTPPDVWVAAELPDTVQAKPASYGAVNLWIIEDNNNLYLFGEGDSWWVGALRHQPAMKLRLSNATYNLHARELDQPDPRLYDKYVARYAEDYPDIVSELPSPEDAIAHGAVFELTRR